MTPFEFLFSLWGLLLGLSLVVVLGGLVRNDIAVSGTTATGALNVRYLVLAFA